jgi:asparagine synthase (glutamine-hydrolysing)
MSVQFGRWNFEGQSPAPDYIEKVSSAIAPYGPDSNESYSKGGVRILYRAFYTTKESRRENQPCISPSGAVITWDGRLDNRAELISELRDSVTVDSTDLAIVAVAYEKWGANCLGKLIGDWALSIWNPRERSVLLAKDPIGTKHLFYSIEKDEVTWSTILDPLALFAGRTFEICEEYIAGWFSCRPAAHLTPYVGIHTVPPSSSVLLRPGNHIVSKYWNFDPGNRIRYRTDTEYEEHFRAVFATAVQRRLRADRPVLAELSGGMDSSSIVCIADTIIARRAAECPRLDTISWFDDSYDHIEPDTNECRYFTRVEEKRGRTGYHINLGVLKQKEVSARRSFTSDFEGDRFTAIPSPHGELSEHFQQYSAFMKSQGLRVTLSGIGGEEATGGGVPTPRPELQNLLARARLFTLVSQLKAWAAKMRKPRLPLLWGAVRQFFPLAPKDIPEYIELAAPWFDPGFVGRNHTALRGYPSRTNLFGPLPSFQDNIDYLGLNRRFLAYYSLRSELLREIRYPYFDLDLLEFAYAIPWEQMVRVGQRRSLMKRALFGIVPDELLNRKRRAFVPQDAKKTNTTEWPSELEIGQHLISGSLGIIDPHRLLEALRKARRNEEVPVGSLMKTLTFECWLRHLTSRGVLNNSLDRKGQERLSSLEAQELEEATQFTSSANKLCTSISQKKGGENHEIRSSRTDCPDIRDQCYSGDRGQAPG